MPSTTYAPTAPTNGIPAMSGSIQVDPRFAGPQPSAFGPQPMTIPPSRVLTPMTTGWSSQSNVSPQLPGQQPPVEMQQQLLQHQMQMQLQQPGGQLPVRTGPATTVSYPQPGQMWR
jgi:hypothetical protein